MKIWIDGYEANVSQRLGSGQVAFELLKNIEELDHKNDYTILLPSKPLEDLPKPRKGFEYRILKPRRFWTRIALPLALFRAKTKPDVIFSPTHYSPLFSSVKRVNMIFDLAFLKFPEYFKKRDLFQLTQWTKTSAKSATHIVTISKSTKKDIIKFFEVNEEKISIAYPGYNSELFYPISDTQKINQIKDKYKIQKPYIIYIGTIQPRKNLKRLIQAFQKIEDLQLMIVGKTTGLGRQGWMYEEILSLPKELSIEEKIIFTGFAPDQDLPLLINGAVAYILPSLYEGFGIPAVEAMACGVPVIVSNVSSLPEVVGDAGLLIDPNSVDQIEQSIRTISSDVKLQQRMSRLSIEQAKKFSWKKMAKETVQVLEKI